MSNHQENQSTSPKNASAQQNDSEVFGPVIFAYTRKMALADGVQVNVSEMAKEAGFKFPVFLTEAVHGRYVQVPDGVEGQDEQGRLWDILWMLHVTIKRTTEGLNRLLFSLYVRNTNGKPRKVVLVAQVGPLDIDDPSPCITVMMPDED